jgi:hypothetical protein
MTASSIFVTRSGEWYSADEGWFLDTEDWTPQDFDIFDSWDWEHKCMYLHHRQNNATPIGFIRWVVPTTTTTTTDTRRKKVR